ncbi:formate nitrite [Moniliophthora roreri MCA 2997]|uniref:Formate nitrite n=1 Tax=Moniliophthora roreri (strain MCA 2997) TaxID=1381753 RepID=V2XDB3_MONRO|nr:formate nitrite [Moniliophthora roreri MCA 2997]
MDTPSTLKPAAVAAAMVQHGVAKHKDRYEAVFIKAFLAGVYLSFGGLIFEILSGGATTLTRTDPGIIKVLAAFTFPVGLVMIVLTGQELLTSNMMVMPMAAIKGAIPWWSIPLNWLIVTFGNLVGSLFFAAILVRYSGIVSAEPYHTSIQMFAIHKAADPEWHQIFLRGIGCNWLVCIAVWQAAGAKDTISKIFAIWIPIWVFVACGFDHVVANMFSIPLGIMFGADLTVAEYIRKSFIASYIGNIVGALLVGLPAVYFYLSDYEAGGLRTAETGEALNERNVTVEPPSRGDSMRSDNTENGKH